MLLGGFEVWRLFPCKISIRAEIPKHCMDKCHCDSCHLFQIVLRDYIQILLEMTLNELEVAFISQLLFWPQLNTDADQVSVMDPCLWSYLNDKS